MLGVGILVNEGVDEGVNVSGDKFTPLAVVVCAGAGCKVETFLSESPDELLPTSVETTFPTCMLETFILEEISILEPDYKRDNSSVMTYVSTELTIFLQRACLPIRC